MRSRTGCFGAGTLDNGFWPDSFNTVLILNRVAFLVIGRARTVVVMMDTIATGLIVVGTLALVYVTAKAPHAPRRNPLICTRDLAAGNLDLMPPPANGRDGAGDSKPTL